MSLTPGTRIGRYEVTAQIGVGGMGEVFRALDTNLGRQVAIKILPDTFAHDPKRLARFEREAKTLASLNHPNIAHIYGLEKTDGIRALVMELVEGPTLAERIAQGPIPLDDALQIARQIAEALEAAHEQGVIHRDLKPANIKLRPDGVVKVLDFGLAKAPEPTGSAPDASQSPTITSPALTQIGVILGTAAYMSPEQARGKPIDKRADIWAFGCVLYEMLTGRGAFAGETITDILAAIVERDPDWTAFPTKTPPAVLNLLRRCVHRDARRRLRDIGEARVAFDAVVAESSHVISQANRTHPRSPSPVAVLVGAAILLALGFGSAWWYWQLRPGPKSAAPDAVAFPLLPPTGEAFGSLPQPQALPSPDGSRLLFNTGQGPTTRWWLRILGTAEPTAIDSARGSDSMAWAPDGRQLVFCQERVLMIASLSGSPPTRVGDGCLPFSGVSWGTSGDILFSTGSGIVRTTSAGNRQEPITIATEQEGVLTHSYPAFLPDGQHYVFLQKGTSPDTSGIYLSRLGAATRTRLVSDLSRPVVVADSDGRIDLVFVRRGSLLVQRFDLAERRLLGEPAVLASGIRLTLTGHNGAYAASTTVLAYRSGGTVFDVSRLVWFDRGGARVGTVETNPDTSITSLSLSPDQNALLFGQYDRDANTIGIWEYNVERGIAQPVLRDPFVSFDSPDWMPARQGFVLNSNATGRWQSRVWSFDRQARQPSPLRSAEQLLDLSDDGRFLIVARASGSGNDPTPDTWVIPMEDRKPPFTVVSGRFSKDVAHLSPDGRWLAFASGEAGHGSDVYLQRFPSGTRIRVSTDGGLDPQWRKDGRELYYLTTDGTLRAVEIGGGETPTIGQSRTLFRAPLGESVQPLLSRRSHFVPSADGQRFLFIVPVGTPAPVMIVTNWRSQLER